MFHCHLFPGVAAAHQNRNVFQKTLHFSPHRTPRTISHAKDFSLTLGTGLSICISFVRCCVACVLVCCSVVDVRRFGLFRALCVVCFIPLSFLSPDFNCDAIAISYPSVHEQQHVGRVQRDAGGRRKVKHSGLFIIATTNTRKQYFISHNRKKKKEHEQNARTRHALMLQSTVMNGNGMEWNEVESE